MRWINLIVSIFVLTSCGGGESVENSLDQIGKDAVDVVDSRTGDACQPACEGQVCGDDGCGGSCGGCDIGRQCDAGQCVDIPCENSTDCPGNLVCDKDSGACVECTGDEDCPEGLTCGEDHQCHMVHECESDIDCKQYDMVCDKDNGECVECLEDSDCEDAEYCNTGYCVADACTAGEKKCEENTVRECSANGSEWTIKKECAANQYCEEAACHDYLCDPGEVFCDGQVYKVCDQAGKGLQYEEDCGAKDQYCSNQGCIDTVCPPSEVYCTGPAKVGTCSSDGMTLTEEDCQPEHYCEAGTCHEWLCIPETAYCAGTIAAVCNTLGSGHLTEKDCTDDDETCVNGECLACQPQCQGKDCGDDSCGGSCGTCSVGAVCIDGICPQPGFECDDGNEDAWDGCTGGMLSETLSNSEFAGNQIGPDVAMNSDGGFFLVWTSTTIDNENTGIAGRHFSQAGKASGPDFLVNTNQAGSQTNPAVAVCDDGYIVVWESEEGSDKRVVATRFSSSGTILVDEFEVEPDESGDQELPDVWCRPSGEFVVGWRNLDAVEDGVRIKAFMPNGISKWNTNVETGSTGVRFSDCGDGEGIALVISDQTTWDSIVVYRISDDGLSDEPEELMNEPWGTKPLSFPSAVCRPDSYFVSWSSGEDMFLSRYTLQPEFQEAWTIQVNSSGPEVTGWPSVLELSSGDFWVVWTGNEEIGNPDIYRIQVSEVGSLVGVPKLINTFVTGYQSGATATTSMGQNLVIVWSSEGIDGDASAIMARRYDNEGAMIF